MKIGTQLDRRGNTRTDETTVDDNCLHSGLLVRLIILEARINKYVILYTLHDMNKRSTLSQINPKKRKIVERLYGGRQPMYTRERECMATTKAGHK